MTDGRHAMPRSLSAAALAALVLLAAPPAPAGIGEADYARVNAALVESHVLPRYERLASATSALAAAADGLCAGGLGRDEARARFHDAMDAWMGVRHLRFGPAEMFMRADRFHFWPQARGKALAAVRALLAAGGDALAPSRIRQASVAAQGLLAVEILLHAGGRADVDAAASPAACRLLQAAAGNLRGMAAGMAADWRDGEASFARAVARPGPGDPRFESHRDATLAFFRSLNDGLQLVAEAKLRPVIGGAAAAARPRLAESRPSGRSARNVVVNLEALRALYQGEGGPGLGDLAGAVDPKLDQLLRKAFRLTVATARLIGRPVEEAAADPALRPKAEKLALQARALWQLARRRLAPALGFSAAFNSLDGD